MFDKWHGGHLKKGKEYWIYLLANFDGWTYCGDHPSTGLPMTGSTVYQYKNTTNFLL